VRESDHRDGFLSWGESGLHTVGRKKMGDARWVLPMSEGRRGKGGCVARLVLGRGSVAGLRPGSWEKWGLGRARGEGNRPRGGRPGGWAELGFVFLPLFLFFFSFPKPFSN